MAFTGSLPRLSPSSLQLSPLPSSFSSSIHVESSLLSLSSFLHTDSPLHFPLSTLSGRYRRSRSNFVIYAKKGSGLEEAMRIRRQRDLQKTLPVSVEKFKSLRRGKVSGCLSVPDEIPRSLMSV
ncbi:hypothetical protein MKX01_032459 [Papaver californicum]|nr:hypothetical protein MKX01_032459 [Papaver californicum]